jgi:hypothetical protein
MLGLRTVCVYLKGKHDFFEFSSVVYDLRFKVCSSKMEIIPALAPEFNNSLLLLAYSNRESARTGAAPRALQTEVSTSHNKTNILRTKVTNSVCIHIMV